jgi:hypothetical protein
MRRLILLLLSGLASAAVGAAGPSPPSPGAERLRQWRRDEELIRELVEKGIQLSREEDPLGRAGQCRGLADLLLREIRRAAAAGDGDRVHVLGGQLQAVLETGVAANLRSARAGIAPGSKRERIFREFGRQVRRLEKELGSAPSPRPEDLRSALEAVRKGRAEVEKAIRSRNPAEK